MTDPTKPLEPQEKGFKVFKGRRLAPIVGPWISSVTIAGAVFYMETTIPALGEVAGLIYFVLVIVIVITTGRWLRVRVGDRRSGDRRNPR